MLWGRQTPLSVYVSFVQAGDWSSARTIANQEPLPGSRGFEFTPS